MYQCLIGLLLSPAAPVNGLLLPDQVIRDAAAGWDSYSRDTKDVQGSCSTEITNSGQLMEKHSVQFRCGPSAGLTVVTREWRRKLSDPFQTRRSVIGANSRYAFELEQPPTAPPGTWLVRSLKPASFEKQEFDKLADV